MELEPEPTEPEHEIEFEDKNKNESDTEDAHEIQIDHPQIEPEPERRSLRQQGMNPTMNTGQIHSELQPHNAPPTNHVNLFTSGFREAVRALEREHSGFIIFVASAIEQYTNLEASKVTPQYGVNKGIKMFGDCPTGDMLADYLTKPLQGSQFKRLRNAIQGITDAEYLELKTAYEAARRASKDP